ARGAGRLLAGRDDAAHAYLRAVRVDREGEAPRLRIGAQRAAHLRLQREVGERPERLVVLAEFLLLGELHDLLGALLDAHALGVQRQAVAFRVLAVDAEVALDDRRLRLVAVAYLRGDGVAVVGVQPRHHALHAHVEGRAHAHADRVRHRPQQVGRAPAAH